ncbi:hypothetical protein [Sphingomonas sp. RIT328]|uniref:hypothetical protein n=1 Tax=Sphingomonas sp. RIT328 TaxID=1470591 RepID=UPI00044E447C|nr:hypothetical protein [Sphingomonas sp. RIT328]EZP57271.1 hypothetical protein BW41_00114 [Sphingomonas sp. RIT328]
MPQLSTAIRNAMGNAIEATIGASPVLEYRTGLPPASPAAASTGTLLMSGTLAADWAPDAANGVKSFNANMKADAAVAAGYAGHFRIKAADGTYHMQGLVSEAWTASKPYVVGMQVNLGGNVYRATAAGTSAANGGPAGTGAAIVDNGVTWAYVGPQDMVLTNTNIALGQDGITLNSYQLTMPTGN